jgi:hypothetical protein
VEGEEEALEEPEDFPPPPPRMVRYEGEKVIDQRPDGLGLLDEALEHVSIPVNWKLTPAEKTMNEHSSRGKTRFIRECSSET